MNACWTISAETAPLDISSFKVAIDFPVFSEIICNGLNPAFIIWFKSCPISLPAADICENAKVSELNLLDSPIEISLMAFKYLIVSSACMLNPSIIFSAPTISDIVSGEILASSLICGISCPAISFPTIVSIAVCMDWNSPQTRIISEPNAFNTPAPPITANAFFQEIAIPLLLSTISLALSL